MRCVRSVIAVTLLLSLILSLLSCKEEYNREYNKEEVEHEAMRLINESLILNEIIYGKGIDYIEDDTNLIYKKADKASLEYYKINSLSDIKTRLSSVFSKSYVDAIYRSDIFTPLVEDDVTKRYARYFEEENDGVLDIFVNICYDYALKNSYEYVGGVVADRSVGDYVYVKATVKATREDGKVKEFPIEIRLVEEENGWRLASSTYLVYNEYTDIYEDMTK